MTAFRKLGLVAGLLVVAGVSHAEVSSATKKLDRNGDGKITLEEYSAGVGKTFKNIDQNKDEVLETEEIRAYYLTIADESDPKTKKRIDGVLHADANGDGKVTVDELKDHYKKKFEKEDKNGDGVITDADS
ncbi:MAG: EF-hand domain-containing protein [Solimonas sp.]